jgi:hypothetical protein
VENEDHDDDDDDDTSVNVDDNITVDMNRFIPRQL